MQKDKQTHFLVAGASYWGRGKTIEEAVQAAKWLRPGNKVLVLKCDAEAHFTDGFILRYQKDVGYSDLGSGKVTRKGGVRFEQSA